MTRTLRVLHTESSPSLGGQELRILLEMEALVDRGINSVLAARPDTPILAEARRRGLTAVAIPMRSNLSPTSLWAFRQLLRDQRIDVVNAHNSKDAWNVAPVARLLGVPVIRARHIAGRLRAGWWRRLPYGPLCDAVLTTSESIKAGLAAAGVAADKIEVIPTGIDMARFQVPRSGAVRREWGIPANARLVGQIAVMRSDKGPDIFAQAAQRLLADGFDAWFVLVGEGRMREKVLAQLSPAERERILLPGFRRDIPEILAELDIAVLAARSPEGVPQAILQAHAARVPVVATSVGGIAEVAIGDLTALAVPPKDPAALAAAIRRLADDPALGQRLAQAGHDLVARQHTLEHMLSRMEALYRRLAK